MLIPFIELEHTSIDSFNQKLLSDLNLVSDVLLKIPVSYFNDEESRIPALYETLRMNIHSYHGLYIEGFNINDEESLVACLDKGLKIAFIVYENEATVAPQTYIETIQALPRSRIGISYDLRNHSYISIIESLRSIIASFASVVEHFFFK